MSYMSVRVSLSMGLSDGQVICMPIMSLKDTSWKDETGIYQIHGLRPSIISLKKCVYTGHALFGLTIADTFKNQIGKPGFF